MKVEARGGTGRIARVANPYARPEMRESQAAPVVEASVLGIPEAEFTPRVQDAVTTLMHEIDSLRRDVAAARARLEDAARTADQDMLLPIYNRRAFVREISRFIAFATRYGTPSSLIYFDLDDFKTINDRYGHAAGDTVLRHFVDVLAQQIRDTDVLARLGGDEFGVILAHVTIDQAMKKAADLASAVRKNPAVWKGNVIPVECSHGAYELRAGETADAAMANADQAMYAQKRSAR